MLFLNHLIKNRKLIFAVFVFLLVLSGIKVVHEMDKQGFFIDEVSDTFAAYNFFIQGDYTSHFFSGGQKFGPTLSVGLASSWPGGLTWVLGGGLWESRMALAIVAFLEAFFLFFCFLRRQQLDPLVSCLGAIVAWSLLLMTPYWFGFMLNLGEFTGAVLLGWGVFFLPRRPLAAFILMGLSVWSCKFIYGPAAFFFWLATVCNQESWNARIKFGLKMGIAFLAPLLIWMGLIALKYDLASLVEWGIRFKNFVVVGKSGLNEEPIPLLDRFSTSLLEWRTYTPTLKIKVLGLYLLPFAIFIVHGFRNRFRLKEWSRKGVLAGLISLAFYGAWYFCYSPTMYLRHAQPGMFIGFGLILFFLFKFVQETHRNPKMKMAWATLLLAFVLKESLTATTRFPVLQPDSLSYPRNCQEDLTRMPCISSDVERYIRRIEAGEPHIDGKLLDP